MAVSGHLLILLVPVLSLCGATEYYVRPTEPTDTSCPAQPCLTFNQYANDSDHYFKSNTVFRFLPGTHNMDRPLTIRHVQNISLESLSDESDEYPHLVAQFSCEIEGRECIYLYWSKHLSAFNVCCAAVWLHDVHSVTVKGISITVQTSNMSVVILKNVSGITVQLNATCSLTDGTLDGTTGIILYGATSVEVHSSSVNNCSYGFVLHNTTNTHITKVTTMYNEVVGIVLYTSTDTSINDTIVANNGRVGMFLTDMNNTHITNTTAAYHGFGMYLSHMNNTHIATTTTAHNNRSGIHLSHMSNTHITNTTAAYNFLGMDLSDTNNTHITNTTTAHNHLYGMDLSDTNNTHITNTTTAHNHLYGMDLSDMNNTHITNTITAHNDWFGMVLQDMQNTHITSTTAAYNLLGMCLSNMNNTHISNTTTAHNGEDGINLSDMKNTHITNTTTVHNGGNGMFLKHMNSTHITNTTTAHNDLDGMYLSYVRNTHIANTTATHNGEYGMNLLYISNISMTRTTVKHNGHTIDSLEKFNGQVVIYFSTTILIYNTSFTGVSAQSITNTAHATSLPALIVIYQSMLLVSGCNFTGNNISAMAAFASNITVSGDLTFSNNKALVGTAFILIQDSILTSAENSHIYFLSNNATNTGGVLYIAGNSVALHENFEEYYSRSACFLNTEGSRFQTRFTFANNSAGIGGDILYGGQVALGLDGDWNCLESFKNTSNISQNGLSLISSDPLRVCLCNGTGQPDCLAFADPTRHTVYPGQTITVSAVAVGQDFGTVAGSAYAQFLWEGNPPQPTSEQKVQSVTQHNCNNLSYTIFWQDQMSEAVLVITAQDSYVSQFINDTANNKRRYRMKVEYSLRNEHAVEPLLYSNSPVYVNVSILPCPPGFMLTSDSPLMCDCARMLQKMPGILCYIQEQTIGRGGLLWVGMIQDDNGTNGTVAASEYCSLHYCNTEESNVTLSEPDSQCNFNHSGTLCGRCQPGLSLALGSAQCLQCSNKYLVLLIPLTMAGPALVFSIKLLDLTISQGTLNGLIFYANVIKANEYIFFAQGQTNPLTVFIAWLNLDLGVETCLFQGLTAYSKTWLQFVFPFYIWSIAGLIMILAKYCDRVAKVMGNNSVPVLATLFLLSHAKLLRTIITALSYTIVYTSYGPKAVWTADGNLDYLSAQHAPLFITSVAVLLFLWLPYTLLLFLGQWLHMCNCRLVVRLLMKIKPFLDAHYGPLKSKHRYWFGALLLGRAAILLISALTPANRSSVVVLCISVIAVVLTYSGQMVYHNLAVAMFDIAFFMNLALLTGANSFITTAGGDLAASAYTLIGLTFVQFVGLVIFKVFSILKQSEKVMRCLHRRQPVEDDWELYEQAALLREMESDTEEQDSESSGSIESLPTY